MNRHRLVMGMSLLLALALMAGAGSLLNPINQSRAELGLTVTPRVVENMPPQLQAATTMLGSLRGVAVAYLWGRAQQQQDQGRFYDANRLATWITTLQPRYPAVWGFHAWNMAYNIANSTRTPAERWLWVDRSVRLLRDQALVYNPTSIELHHELAQFFLNKIGSLTDDSHVYYKQQLAAQWDALLGPQVPGQEIAAFKQIAQAAEQIDAYRRAGGDALSAFISEYPQAKAALDRLRAMGLDADEPTLRRVARTQAFGRWQGLGWTPPQATDAQNAAVEGPAADPAQDTALAAWLNDAPIAQGRIELLTFIRALVITDVYHMRPGYMLKLMEEYGPVDWRHPGAHGLYWASLGLEEYRKRPEQRGSAIAELNTNRNVLAGLKLLSEGGRVSFDPISGRYEIIPDARFAEGYIRMAWATYDEFTRRQAAFNKEHAIEGESELTDYGFGPLTFKQGLENFMSVLVYGLYYSGQFEAAQKTYDQMRERFADMPRRPGPIPPPRYELTLADFVLSQAAADIHSPEAAGGMVSNLWSYAIHTGLSMGDKPAFTRLRGEALRVYNVYQKTLQERQKTEDSRARMALPDFEQMGLKAFSEYMARTDGLDPSARFWAYRNAPANWRYFMYFDTDRRQSLYQLAAKLNLDPLKAFPEPDGYKEYVEKYIKPHQLPPKPPREVPAGP